MNNKKEPRTRTFNLDKELHHRLKAEQARLCLNGIDKTLNQILIDMIYELDELKAEQTNR